MNDIQGATGIYHDYAMGFAPCDRQICLMNPIEECIALFLKAIFVGLVLRSVRLLTIATPRPLHTCRDVGIHEDGEIRPQAPAYDAVQLENRFDPETASSTLVGFGRIGKAITQHPLSGFECRQNHLGDLLGARGKHQSHLGQRIEAGGAGIQQDGADAFADGGAAGFASGQHVDTLGAQHRRKLLQLRRLAATVEAFEGNEFAALSGLSQASIIPAGFGTNVSREKPNSPAS